MKFELRDSKDRLLQTSEILPMQSVRLSVGKAVDDAYYIEAIQVLCSGSYLNQKRERPDPVIEDEHGNSWSKEEFIEFVGGPNAESAWELCVHLYEMGRNAAEQD